ncbi:MAG: hypothetical protein L3J56_09220 [Bacteroidales bacterium]|nr:hypothetical protein [Bacteroidales bacterium]
MSFQLTTKKTVLTLIISLISLNISAQNKQAYVSADYKKFGLKSGNIPEIREDGIRTDGKKGTYEWWYFDAHLDDGTTVVIVFYTKPFTEIKKGLIPFISINIDRPDGTSIKKPHYGKVEEFSASDKTCDVKIGENYFRGDLKNYEIHFKDEELTVDVKMHRTTESWRPKTGHFIYGNSGKEFAWLVPVPKGEAEISYSYKGKTYNLKGSCYHDHNFGNANMADVINHWYWSRAEVGPYTVIAAELISVKEYDSEPVIVYCLSKNGKTLADDGEKVKLFRIYGKMNPAGERPVSNILKFIYEDENESVKYEYTLTRKTNLMELKLLDALIHNPVKRKLAIAVSGLDPAYFRMSGTANLKIYKNDCKTEEYTSNKAIWELMYFGRPYE